MHDLVSLMTLVNVCSEFVETEAKHKRPNQPHADASLKRTKLEFDEDTPLARETELNPIGGSSCHQCKSRRNAQDLTFCTSSLTKKSRGAQCRKKYCDHCLTKFYQDIPSPGTEKGWRCPSCRDMCCCAACRRREGSSSRIPLRAPMSTPAPHRTIAPRSRVQLEGARAPVAVVRSSVTAGSQPQRHVALADIPDKALEGALLLTSLNPDAEPHRYFPSNNGSYAAYNISPQKGWPVKEVPWSCPYDDENESEEEDGKVQARDPINGWNYAFTPGYALPPGHRRSSSMGQLGQRRDRYSADYPPSVVYGYRRSELHPSEVTRLPLLPGEVQDELIPSVVKPGQGYVSPERRQQFERPGFEDRPRPTHFTNDFFEARLISSRAKCELLQQLEGSNRMEIGSRSPSPGTDQEQGHKFDTRSLATHPEIVNMGDVKSRCPANDGRNAFKGTHDRYSGEENN